MKKSLLVIVLLIGLLATGCTMGNKTKTINVKIYDKEDVLLYEQRIISNEKYLLDALEQFDNLKVVTKETDKGKTITSLYDLTEDDEYELNYYVNDKVITKDESAYKIKDNDQIRFKIEKS